MIGITIILPQGCVLQHSITQLLNVFDWVNSHVIEQDKQVLFHVEFAAVSSPVEMYGSMLSVRPSVTLADFCESDIVIVPALAGNIADALQQNQAFIPWLHIQYERGAEIAGLCTGALMLADTHLLKEALCRKNWFVTAQFRKEFSQVSEITGNIVVEEKAIRTTRGAYTFIHELLEKFTHPELAAACADRFEQEFNQSFQSLFSIVQCKEINTLIPGKKQIRTNRNYFTKNSFSDQFNDICYPAPDCPVHVSQKLRKNSSTLKAIFKTAGER